MIVKLQNSKSKNSNKYDLEERTQHFAERVRDYTKSLPRTVTNFEYGRQLIRSSGSQAANYIEVNEALGPKDRLMKLRTCRKEAKESKLWLRLTEPLPAKIQEKKDLMQEADELIRIFGSIIEKLR